MLTLRPIEPQDNAAVLNIVQTVLAEFGCIGPGWASGDSELQHMFETYQRPGFCYWVVEDTATGVVLGGGGVGLLKETVPADGVCELQKLYFLPAARGKGVGKKLLTHLVGEGQRLGYRTMYLESIPQLESAVALYEKVGFQRIPQHMGNTGHQKNCNVYMTMDLTRQMPQGVESAALA